MPKILITGPESSGKTQLTQSLARHFRAPWVREFSRTYLDDLDRPYRENDLLRILDGQLRLQQQYGEAPLLFCDTGPEVIYVWSDVKYERVHAHIEEMLHQYHYDLTLLCYPDLPWESDPLRDAPAPAQRQALLERYQHLLQKLDRPYVAVTGRGDERENVAVRAVEKLLSGS